MAKIHALYIYPVKSFQGIKLTKSLCLVQGLQYDRQWMCINPTTGKMHTQRTVPKMAQIQCIIDNMALYLQFGQYRFTLAHDLGGDVCMATVWRDTVPAVVQNPTDDTHFITLSDALTDFLQTDAQVLKFAADAIRPVTGSDTGVVQFADRYPYTVADVADLQNLNAFLQQNGQQPVQMQRFRANIILSGCRADVGNHYASFTITPTQGEGIQGTFCEPCTRCPIPDLNPDTGTKTNHNLRASLKKMRHSQINWFSTHSILHIKTPVEIKVGDKVDVHTPPPVVQQME